MGRRRFAAHLSPQGAPQCHRDCSTPPAGAYNAGVTGKRGSWVQLLLVALGYSALVLAAGTLLPGGAGGGSLVQERPNAGESMPRPPVADETAQVHILGGQQSARVFWQSPEPGRLRLTIELEPEEEDDAPGDDLILRPGER